MPYDPSAVAGTTLAVSASSPVSYSDVPGVFSFSIDGNSRGEINVTTISDESEQFIPGRRSPGSAQLSLFLDHAWSSHQSLWSNFTSGTEDLLQFRVTNDDAGDSTETFQGFVQSWSFKYDKDGAKMADLTIKISGDITVAP